MFYPEWAKRAKIGNFSSTDTEWMKKKLFCSFIVVVAYKCKKAACKNIVSTVDSFFLKMDLTNIHNIFQNIHVNCHEKCSHCNKVSLESEESSVP